MRSPLNFDKFVSTSYSVLSIIGAQSNAFSSKVTLSPILHLIFVTSIINASIHTFPQFNLSSPLIFTFNLFDNFLGSPSPYPRGMVATVIFSFAVYPHKYPICSPLFTF